MFCAIFQEWEPVVHRAALDATPARPPTTSPVPRPGPGGSVRQLASAVRTTIHIERLRRTWTVGHVARTIGIPEHDLVAIERGDEFPTPETFARLEQLFGCTLM